MKVDRKVFLAELIEKTKDNLNQIEKFNQLTDEVLNKKENTSSWSVLECIAHLNIYGDFYLPEIERVLSSSSSKYNAHFKSGFIGGYFVKLIQPKENLNKMKTLKKFDPIGSSLSKDVLEVFREQQFRMLELLSRAESVDLTKLKTKVSISKIIKMRLGDTFKFVILHNQRHLNQANKVLRNS